MWSCMYVFIQGVCMCVCYACVFIHSVCLKVRFMTRWLRPLGPSWSGTVSLEIVDSGVFRGVGGGGEGEAGGRYRNLCTINRDFFPSF